MLFLCTPKRTSPLPLDKDSREILRTGELRIGDSVYELSEYAEFVVSLCIGRAKILLTLDRGKVIYPMSLNPALRAKAILYLWKDSGKRLPEDNDMRLPPPRSFRRRNRKTLPLLRVN